MGERSGVPAGWGAWLPTRIRLNGGFTGAVLGRLESGPSVRTVDGQMAPEASHGVF